MPNVHIRQHDRQYMGLCGAGSDWPNTTLFENESRKATCIKCINIQIVEALQVGNSNG